jgi:DnaJ-class molecular chaperone
MHTYREVLEAKELLGLPERATLREIKSRYRSLLTEWHPDKQRADRERCSEMTRKIVAAYKTISEYCNRYAYSFSKEEIKEQLPADDRWFERFGEDPIWGQK